MPKAPADQNYLATPLDELLGAPANVRLLRLLCDQVSESISAPDAAAQIGLTEAGTRRALKRLTETGFVERLGRSRSQQYRLAPTDDPLISQLRLLFKTERDRYEDLLSTLRSILSQFPEITTSWIDQPPGSAGQALHIGMLAQSDVLSYLEEQVRSRIVEIEGKFDTIIEIRAFSRADAPEVNWNSVTLLAGHAVEAGTALPAPRSHDDRAERALQWSEVIAQMIMENPSIIRRAERHLEYLLDEDQGTSWHDLREWKEIIQFYSRARLKAFLVADSPRAQRLRQSSPFYAVLTPDERDSLVDQVAERDA
jgi:DNA-binding transcriptional ArsR family regulator